MRNSDNFWFGPQTNTPITGQHNIKVVWGKLGCKCNIDSEFDPVTGFVNTV